MKMRAVCLREPWLYLMLDLPEEFRKTVENRSRCLTRSLGPILAKSSTVNHGSKKLNYEDSDANYYASVRKQVLGWGWFPEDLFPKFEQLQFGGIRGALNFSQLLPPGFGADLRWKFPECFGYVVDRYVRFPFRPLKGGGQGIFYTEPTTEERALLIAAGITDPSSYPYCGPLGSDVAELQAFKATLELSAKLKAEGHTDSCVTGQVGLEQPCRCAKAAAQP